MQLRSLLLITAFSLGTLTPPSLPAQEAPLHTATQQELDVVKVMLKQETAWNKGDIDGFTEGYKNAPDTLFISRQITRGFEGMAATYHQSYPNRAAMGNLGFSELEVRPLGTDFAVCIGKFHLERSKKDGGSADGIFSLVFEKTEQGWKIILDHTT
jgi:ketosteroid isomerase-like protein